MAEWLLPKLDTLTPSATGNDTPVIGSADDFLRVFYLKNQTSMVGVSKVFEAIGGAPQIGKTYYYSITPPAIVVRGSAAQIAVAKAIVEATDQPSN